MQGKRRLTQFVVSQWYQSSLSFFSIILMPFSWLFLAIALLRRWFYQSKSQRFSLPIIVVGNIAVGGTGKTPFVIWLAELLKTQGFRPGIISRGVGGKQHLTPYRVAISDNATEVGDEALLLAATNCPVVVCVNRCDAVQFLIQNTDCNIVISDDGLQHYKLARDLEIVLVDSARQFGNKQLLPAGPLREPISRLKTVDFVVTNGPADSSISMQLEPTDVISLVDQTIVPFKQFTRQKVHAVAGIGNPERFFTMLRDAGFDVIPHVFPDHYGYHAADFDFVGTLPILMTEKDAVKCQAFADERYWYVKVKAILPQSFEQQLLTKIRAENKHDSEEDFSKRTCRMDKHC